MMILKEFSRIVCVSLFSYQGSLFVCLSDSSFTLSHSPAPVKYFFKFFSRHFLMSVCRSQATCLLYHILTGLSTTFFAFFKTFQIVYSEETILRDSSVRITLSNRAVNTFLNIFTIFFNFLIVLHNESNRILNPGYVDQIHARDLPHR